MATIKQLEQRRRYRTKGSLSFVANHLKRLKEDCSGLSPDEIAYISATATKLSQMSRKLSCKVPS